MKKYTLPSGGASIMANDDGSVTYSVPGSQTVQSLALKEALRELVKSSGNDSRAHKLISTGNYVAVRRDWVKKIKKLHYSLFTKERVGIHALSTPRHGIQILDAISEMHKDPELFVGGDDGSIY